MNHRRRHLPLRRKTGMELAHRIAQSWEQFARVIGRGSQTVHQRLKRIALDVFHDHVEIIADAATVNDSGQVLKSSTRSLGCKQALIGTTDLRRRIDALAHKRSKRTAARAFEIHELGRLDRRALKHAINAIAVVTVERRQVLSERGSQLIVGICWVLSIHSVHNSAGHGRPAASVPCAFRAFLNGSKLGTTG